MARRKDIKLKSKNEQLTNCNCVRNWFNGTLGDTFYGSLLVNDGYTHDSFGCFYRIGRGECWYNDLW